MSSEKQQQIIQTEIKIHGDTTRSTSPHDRYMPSRKFPAGHKTTQELTLDYKFLKVDGAMEIKTPKKWELTN